MLTKHRVTQSAFAFAALAGVAALVLLPACDAESDAGPRQAVVEDIDHSSLDALLDIAQVDPENDDFAIVVEPSDELTPHCPLEANGDPGPWEDECGYCTCSDSGIVYCIDLMCDPERELDVAPPALLCDDGEHFTGDKWNDGCNDCWCGHDGAVVCTVKRCED